MYIRKNIIRKRLREKFFIMLQINLKNVLFCFIMRRNMILDIHYESIFLYIY